MKEFSVAYHLSTEEEADVQSLADEVGRPIENFFESMMQLGSKYDIEQKIKFWKFLSTNTKRKQGQTTSTPS